MNNWNELEDDLDEQNTFSIIPQGTILKVRMSIQRGGHNNPDRVWTDGYATRNPDTGSVYLKVQFVVQAGTYTNRHIWGKIGLHSEKSEAWSRMGRNFVKGILSSVHGISLSDKSEHAKKLRTVSSFSVLDGVTFLARIDVERYTNGQDKNVINRAITPDHNKYKALMEAEPLTLPTPAATHPITHSTPEWA